MALLNRGRKGVTVTDVGELVAREARVLVSRFDNLRNEIISHVGLETGTVRLGGGATAVSFVLPKAIADFKFVIQVFGFNSRRLVAAKWNKTWSTAL